MGEQYRENQRNIKKYIACHPIGLGNLPCPVRLCTLPAYFAGLRIFICLFISLSEHLSPVCNLGGKQQVLPFSSLSAILCFEDQKMSSKISISEEAQTAFKELYNDKRFKWVSFIIENNLIVVNKTLDATAEEAQLEDRECFEKLKSTLTSDQPLFIVYDVTGKSQLSDQEQQRAVLISW